MPVVDELNRQRLRRLAEERLAASERPIPGAANATDSPRLVHELQVHQIELEMQNAELRQVRSELEAALAGYRNLYDFAPVGYFSFDRVGMIVKTNLAGARLLRNDRGTVIGHHFAGFIASDSRREFGDLLKRALKSGDPESSEITLVSEFEPSGRTFVDLNVVASKTDGGFNAVATDITAVTQANELLRKLSLAVE
jgi:PAS domain S-box-containing protein